MSLAQPIGFSITTSVITVHREISTVTTSQAIPVSDYNQSFSLYVTSPARRLIDVELGGDLEKISTKVNPTILARVTEAIENYLTLSK